MDKADTTKIKKELLVEPHQEQPAAITYPSHLFGLGDFYSASPSLEILIDSIYNSLSIEERAAQLIMPATSQYDKIGIPFSEIKTALKKHKIGGVLYLKGTKSKFASEIAELSSITKIQNSPGLLNACDCEPSLYHKKFTDADSIIATSDMKTDALVDFGANEISNQIRQMGILLNFAPVADIGINTEVIGNRAFSANSNELILRASRFVYTTQQAGVAATIKHFPGHGAVIGDTHKSDVYINGELTELNNFARIIQMSNPIAVMVGHMRIINPAFEDIPSTLSRKVITGLLKEEIGFKGIVVTDAMQMQAVLKIKNASWKALVAGADLIIMPKNIDVLHQQIVRSLNDDGKMSTQLSKSIKKIIRLKICTGLL